MAEALSQSEIDSLLTAAAEQGSRRAMRHVSNIYVRKMDFARPTKFNKDQLRTLHMLHESYCRRASTYLSGAVRSMATMSVTASEQIPYGDFVSSLPAPTFTSVLEIAPLNTNAMAAIDLPLLFGMLDRMLGGPGSWNSRARELTEIEVRLASTLVEHLLEELSATWSELVPVDFRLRGVEMNAQFAQIADASEPSVLIVMELAIGTAAGSISLCLPYRSIEKVVGELTAQRYFSGGEDAEIHRTQLLEGLRRVEMPIRAELGKARLPVEQVLALGPGDVISLGRKTNEGVKLVVGNTRTYNAMPGRDGKHLAVRVTERIHGEGEA